VSKLIKKYKNRQLYDTETGNSVTFEDLARGIQAGEEYLVIDNDSEKDITLQTYAQVLYEQIKAGNNVRNYDEIIRQIALKGGNLSMGVLKKTVLAGIGALNLSRKRATEIVEELIKQGELAEGQKAKAVKELMDKGEVRAIEITKQVEEQVKKAVSKIKGPNKEFEKLKQEIAELKAKIKEMEERFEE
jgi:polyhydroxyalkanoate synthesis repressor PhaR